MSSRLLTVLQTVAFPFRHVVVDRPRRIELLCAWFEARCLSNRLRADVEPTIGLEPMLCALRVRCFTAKLRRRGADDRIRTDLLLLTEEALVPTSIIGVAPDERFERP